MQVQVVASSVTNRVDEQGHSVNESVAQVNRQGIFKVMARVASVDTDGGGNERLWLIPIIGNQVIHDSEGEEIKFPSSIPVYSIPGGAEALANKMGTKVSTWYLMSSPISARYEYVAEGDLGTYLNAFGIANKNAIPMYPLRNKPVSVFTEGMTTEDLTKRGAVANQSSKGAFTRMVQNGASQEEIQAGVQTHKANLAGRSMRGINAAKESFNDILGL